MSASSASLSLSATWGVELAPRGRAQLPPAVVGADQEHCRRSRERDRSGHREKRRSEENTESAIHQIIHELATSSPVEHPVEETRGDRAEDHDHQCLHDRRSVDKPLIEAAGEGGQDNDDVPANHEQRAVRRDGTGADVRAKISELPRPAVPLLEL